MLITDQLAQADGLNKITIRRNNAEQIEIVVTDPRDVEELAQAVAERVAGTVLLEHFC